MQTTDFEINFSTHTTAPSLTWAQAIRYLIAGSYFGILLTKSEVISWFRIQEMFRFQSFHMYGVIGSAVVTGALSVWLIKKLKLRTVSGEAITFTPKKFHKGLVAGGLLFGMGWALTGACPGPIFAQIGAGSFASVIVLFSALLGTYVYGAVDSTWRK